MPFYRRQPARRPRRFRAPVKKSSRPVKRRPRRRKVMSVPRLISGGLMAPNAYSTHHFADNITVADQSTESAGLLRYYANFIDTIAGTPTGIFVSQASTPGTNPLFSSGVRTDPVPRGYDTMTALYKTCRVYASRLSVQFMNQEAGADGNTSICLWRNNPNQSFAITTADEVSGSTIPGLRKKIAYPARGPQSGPTISLGWSEKMMTRDNRSENEFTPGADMEAEKNYFNIALVNLFDTTTALAGRLIVKASYSCKWSDPVNLAADDAP